MVQWPDIGIATGKFLVPADGISPSWPVVACDQYTSQPQYWDHAEEIVGDQPSSLRLVLPEAFLNEKAIREQAVLANMRDYLARGILHQSVNGMVLTARTTASGTRLGLVLCLDLEQYNYAADSTSLIRATEGTVESRIPPRLSIRRDAPIEISHIMALVDDPEKTILEPVFALRSCLRLLYDVELMLEGGHLCGWVVEDDATLSGIAQALRSLLDKKPHNSPLIAVGDGNHSLAAAWVHWSELKCKLSCEEKREHPARYAMAELTNLQDDALRFEPIHRILYNAEPGMVLRLLQNAGAVETKDTSDITLVTGTGDTLLSLTRPLHLLSVGTVQKILDDWLDGSSVTIDYIHGEKTLRELAQRSRAVGILLPPMDKNLLFPAVTANGPLPRKTFSMGEANEKRYYLEARRIYG